MSSRETIGSYGTCDSITEHIEATKWENFKQLIVVCVLICVMQMCGKLATETFNETQVLFITNLKMDPKLNDGMTFARERVYMVLLLVCGKLGDNGLGRLNTIMLGAFVYLAGTIMVSLATHPWISRLVWYMAGAFLVLPFSQAALEANLINFGADQFNLSIRGHFVLQERFFSWFNVAIQLGYGLAYALLAFYGISAGSYHYLTSDDFATEDDEHVPDYNYWTSFIASAAAFVIAITLFIHGKQHYSAKSQETLPSSPVVGLTQYLIKHSLGCSLEGVLLLAAKVVGITIYVSQAVLFWSPEWAKPLSIASAMGVIFSVGGIFVFCRNLSWFDHVEPPENQPLALSDVKDFLRLLPLIVCSQMAYGCLYMTMKIWYGRQACQMDFRYWPVGPPELNDPMLFPAFFDVVACATVVVLTPVVLHVVNPRIETRCQQWGCHFTNWSKFVVGVVFAITSVAFAANYEISRRVEPLTDLVSPCAPRGVPFRQKAALWMVIPYVLMGISCTYVVPAIMMISYRQVPKTMRSLTVITNVFMMSASNSVVLAMSAFLHKSMPINLDKGNLEYLYFVAIMVSLVMLILFFSLVPYFEEKTFADTRVTNEDNDEPVAVPAA